MSRSTRSAAFALSAAGIAVFGGLVGGGIVRLTQGSDSIRRRERPRRPPLVAEDVLPSVVTLVVQGPTGDRNGSGAVIRDGGYIVTNDHVTAPPAAESGRIRAALDSGQTQPATIVGRAPALDLAVLRVPDPGRHRLLTRGDSERLRVGQPVVALGVPLGLSGTVTSGIVSALAVTCRCRGTAPAGAPCCRSMSRVP